MRILLLSVFLLFPIPSLIFSQNISTPLEPASPPRQFELGLALGLGGNNQIGEYIPGKYFGECQNCKFLSGNGFGSSLGIVAHRDIIDELQWGASLSLIFSNIASSYQEIEMVPVKLSNNSTENRPIPFKNSAEFDFSFLEFNPFIRWSPVNFFFIKLGFSSSLLLNYHIKQSKELLKFKDTLNTGEIVDLQIDNENPVIKVVDDRDIPETNTLQLYLKPALGFNIAFSERFIVSPYFEYSIPMSKISNLQDNFKISNWRIMFEFKYAFKLRKITTAL